MLILPIKKKWFDMIRSGEKKEEYREIKPYYETRFRNAKMLDDFGGYYGDIILRNGYSYKSPAIIARVYLRKGQGLPEWGAEPGKEYFILDIKYVNDYIFMKTYAEAFFRGRGGKG